VLTSLSLVLPVSFLSTQTLPTLGFAMFHLSLPDIVSVVYPEKGMMIDFQNLICSSFVVGVTLCYTKVGEVASQCSLETVLPV
jgi:hypothetical protein